MKNQSLLKQAALDLAQRIREAELQVEFFAEPFKHLVLDDAIDADLVDSCLNFFPTLDDPTWEFSNIPGIEIKARTTWKSEFDIPEGIIDTVRILNSAQVLLAMSSLFEIPKLMPDPYFTGGGLNCTSSGGLLDVHVDGNYHDASGLNRRMNAILYLNPNYQPEWGGEFGIFDDDGTTLVKSIAPLHNRMVVFDSHDRSFHGLPHPIKFPEQDPRRSIILYYYTAAPRPTDVVTVLEPHSALWRSKGFTDKNGSVTRNFK